MGRWNAADLVSIVLSGLILAGTIAAPHLADGGLLPETSVCLSQRILGVECPGCGMTRSVVALGRGDLASALHWNWVAPAMLVLGLLHIGARSARFAFAGLELRTFDLASLGVIIVVLVVRGVLM